MKNSSNITKYRLIAKYYDTAFEKLLSSSRKNSLSLLEFKEDQKVLLIGVGTGLDIPFIPDYCDITGIDLSDSMLSVARSKYQHKSIEFIKMNAEKLMFENFEFDVVILSLILSVVEEPKSAFREALRVLKADGRVLVFDKFCEGKTTVVRRILNLFTSALGTDINRSFQEISEDFDIEVLEDKAVMFAGNYRAILLVKRQ